MDSRTMLRVDLISHVGDPKDLLFRILETLKDL